MRGGTTSTALRTRGRRIRRRWVNGLLGLFVLVQIICAPPPINPTVASIERALRKTLLKVGLWYRWAMFSDPAAENVNRTLEVEIVYADGGSLAWDERTGLDRIGISNWIDRARFTTWSEGLRRQDQNWRERSGSLFFLRKLSEPGRSIQTIRMYKRNSEIPPPDFTQDYLPLGKEIAWGERELIGEYDVRSKAYR